VIGSAAAFSSTGLSSSRRSVPENAVAVASPVGSCRIAICTSASNGRYSYCDPTRGWTGTPARSVLDRLMVGTGLLRKDERVVLVARELVRLPRRRGG
jgi:hypothetical protein